MRPPSLDPPQPPFRKEVRNFLYQALALIALLLVAFYFFMNAKTNLQQQGIASGFSFLNRPAGFDISMHLIEYNEQSTYLRAFFVGLLNTLLISALGILISTPLGFLIGLARLSKNFLVSKLAMIYIELFRNIPLLLQLFFWYFAVLRALPAPRESWSWGGRIFLNIRGLYLPKPIPSDSFKPFILTLTGTLLVIGGVWIHRKIHSFQTTPPAQSWRRFSLLALFLFPGLVSIGLGSPLQFEDPVLQGFNFQKGIVILPEFSALWLAISLYTAAFIAEIVRAGVLSVPRGQSEAAYSLGLNERSVIRWIILPQALRVIMPPLTSQYLNLTKNSSLAAAIAYPDLVSVFAGTVLNQTGQAVEVIGITLSVYLAISLTLSAVMNGYNRWITRMDA